MNTRATAALLLMSTLLASAGAAQTPTPSAPFVDPVTGVALDDAIALALAREPSIRAARTAADAAEGMRVQAGLRKNPSVSAELRDEPAGADRQTMVTVDWPLDLFRRDGRVAVAEREAAAVALSIADRERLLAADVRSRYGEALVAIRDLATLEELAGSIRRQHDLLRARVDAGASPPIERDLVEVERRRLDADRLLQTARAERAMFELKRVLGMPPDEPLRLRDTLEDVVDRESVNAAAATDASARRADVREAAARVAVADATIERAQREGRFDISLFAGYMRMDAGFPQFGLSSAGRPEPIHGVFHYVIGGATVTLPVFNRNQGEVAAAQAGRRAALALQEAAHLSALAEIAAARASHQRAREAVQLYGGGARSLARQNLSIVGQSYELGRTTIFEVLAEQRRYLDVERAYTETLRLAYEARTALNRALGDMR